MDSHIPKPSPLSPQRLRGGATDDDDEDDNNNNNDNGAPIEEDSKKKAPATQTRHQQKLRDTLDTLHREMDVAAYSKTDNGQYRRVTPKKLSKGKTRKRKLLEKEDDHETAEFDDKEDDNDDTTKSRRLRGSRLALEETVLMNKGSMPILAAAGLSNNNNNDAQGEEDDDDDAVESEEEDDDNDDELEGEEDDNDDDGEGEGEDDLEEEDEQEAEAEGDNGATGNSSPTDATATMDASPPNNNKKDGSKKGTGKKRGPYKKKKQNKAPRPNSVKARRRLFRLKNFKSYKMAQRHGEALGAHARGMPKLAIARLKQVAKDAPSAPQVYSSLGMVFADMYQTSWKNLTSSREKVIEKVLNGDCDDAQATATNDEKEPQEEPQQSDESKNDDDTVPKQVQFAKPPVEEEQQQQSVIHQLQLVSPDYAEAIDLAQKAYGSYHIAAILCKKDYTLWVRAADTACDIAALYAEAREINHHTDNGTSFSSDVIRQEQERWFNEAKGDLQTADNLKPPTLDVPVKLAGLYMELGCLSEALTLWMDLLQQKRGQDLRHNAWALYAECMLRIGYECHEWNVGQGQQNQKNYMFRRWLRKFSQTFDWKERRLQGLVLALKVAAGSKATQRLVEWMQQRAMERHQEQMADQAKEQAALDFAEALMREDDDGEENNTESDHNSNNKKTKETDHGKDDEETNNDVSGDAKQTEESESTTGQVAESDAAEVGVAAEKDSTNAKKQSSPSDPVENDDEFEVEKKLLLENNAAELEAFDQTTANMMNVLGQDNTGGQGQAIKQRNEARQTMTRYHRAQVSRLSAEYQKKDGENGDNREPEKSDNKVGQGASAEVDQDLPLAASVDNENPVAASCRVVTQITAELMKLMLQMKLYHGGRLAGEALSLYNKERARIQDIKAEKRRKMQQRSDPLAALFSSQPPIYDEVQFDADFSEDEDIEAAYLSDEDELDSDEAGPGLLESLRRGALPPEISVLYSLCLIHEGGRNYIAKKCMESIYHLELEGETWISDTPRYQNSKDESWQFYRASATEPLGRVAAFSFVADTLHSSGKDVEWASYFAPIFGALVAELEKHNMTKALIELPSSDSIYLRARVRSVLKCISAWGRLEIKRIRASYLSSVELNAGDGLIREKEAILRTIQQLKRLLHISSSEALFVDGEGAIPEDCVELVKMFADGYSMAMKDDGCVLNKAILEELTSEGEDISLWLSLNSPGIQNQKGQRSTIFDSTEWDHVPLPSSWQSGRHKAVSLRCYNLCISFNVSHFSGWEPHEFSLRLMKTRASCTYFGLKIQHGRVAGFLPSRIQAELGRQWESLGDFLPAASGFKFNVRLEETKKLPWYRDGFEKHSEAMKEDPVAIHAEMEGLEVLLAHSMSCLTLARHKESHERYELLMTSLSIILPITQFCLDEHVWHSDIGKAAAYDDTNLMEGWRQMTRKRAPRSSSGTRRRRKPKEPPKPLDEWFPGENRSNPLSNTVAIPSFALQRLWGVQTDLSRSVPTVHARRAMKKVHDAMEKLRACYTDAAVEKASLQVACALLDLASVNHTCENPFLVLQQAAIFAGHGTKRGNSVDLFREPLPEPSKCLPHDALCILGRADCFQAVYFPYEAAYLCAYVARVCNMHRDAKEPTIYEDDEDDENNNDEASGGETTKVNKKKKASSSISTTSNWSNQWMIVGIQCYNVSIMIRATAADKIVGIKSSRTEESYAPWDQDVVDELLLARADAFAWKSALSKGDITFSHLDCSKKTSEEEYDEEAQEGGQEEDDDGSTGNGDKDVDNEKDVEEETALATTGKKDVEEAAAITGNGTTNSAVPEVKKRNPKRRSSRRSGTK